MESQWGGVFTLQPLERGSGVSARRTDPPAPAHLGAASRHEVEVPQTFHRRMTVIGRLIVFGGPIVSVICGVFLAYGTAWSDWRTEEDFVQPQPVPFSHAHHVRDLGLDCRFCHTSADRDAFAGMPPTKTCMTCHSRIWNLSPMLEPVRSSWFQQQPIAWTRIHDLPDYVYFDHSIHVNKGVGCTTCHGDVQDMPLMRRVVNLQMRWCLGCHRDVENYLRPREEVFLPHYDAPDAARQKALGRQLAAEYHVRSETELTNCSTCHR